jgi:hypothetical protein
MSSDCLLHLQLVSFGICVAWQLTQLFMHVLTRNLKFLEYLINAGCTVALCHKIVAIHYRINNTQSGKAESWRYVFSSTWIEKDT